MLDNSRVAVSLIYAGLQILANVILYVFTASGKDAFPASNIFHFRFHLATEQFVLNILLFSSLHSVFNGMLAE